MFATAMGAREFSLRDPMVFVLYGVVLAFIVALSLYYMLSAFKRAKELGIESSKIKKVITTSATFSILPGLGIALGVVTLIGTLGIAFPAIRLSVVGSLQYETQMANGVAEGLYGSMSNMIAHGISAQDFATMTMIMTIAICSGGVEVLFFYRLYQPKIGKLMAKTTGGKKGGVNIGDLVFQVFYRYGYRLPCNEHRNSRKERDLHRRLLQFYRGFGCDGVYVRLRRAYKQGKLEVARQFFNAAFYAHRDVRRWRYKFLRKQVRLGSLDGFVGFGKRSGRGGEKCLCNDSVRGCDYV